MGGELIERDTSGVRNGTDTVDYSVNSRNPTEKPNENDSKLRSNILVADEETRPAERPPRAAVAVAEVELQTQMNG